MFCPDSFEDKSPIKTRNINPHLLCVCVYDAPTALQKATRIRDAFRLDLYCSEGDSADFLTSESAMMRTSLF